MSKQTISKIVLAYSGGLDTSVILKWLQEQYDCEVVTFTADIGQGEEVEPARSKAEALGVREIYIEDLTETFVRDYVYPMFRANTIYEGEYLLGTSIARPLIAKRLVEIAAETGADAISHGATGKGNDQVRFELGAYALNSDIKVIAPWREWDLNSREKLLKFAEDNGIPIEAKRKGGSPSRCPKTLGDVVGRPPAETAVRVLDLVELRQGALDEDGAHSQQGCGPHPEYGSWAAELQGKGHSG